MPGGLIYFDIYRIRTGKLFGLASALKVSRFTEIMGEDVLCEALRESLEKRLREVEPWMKLDAVQAIVSKCGRLLESEIKQQYVEV